MLCTCTKYLVCDIKYSVLNLLIDFFRSVDECLQKMSGRKKIENPAGHSQSYYACVLYYLKRERGPLSKEGKGATHPP